MLGFLLHFPESAGLAASGRTHLDEINLGLPKSPKYAHKRHSAIRRLGNTPSAAPNGPGATGAAASARAASASILAPTVHQLQPVQRKETTTWLRDPRSKSPRNPSRTKRTKRRAN